MITLNDLARRYHAHKISLTTQVFDVLKSGWWINGQENQRFCLNFGSYIGVKYFVGVANGTDALELSIRALSVKRGAELNEVVMVPNAGGYAASACFAAGLLPVWCDIEEPSQLISINSAISCLSEHTLAVVVTHLYGGLVDVPALRRQMDALGYASVAILEDCAQAHGLRGAPGTAGAMGDIAAFSFYPTKNLGALGDAGGIATSDDELYDLVRKFQQYGWDTKYSVSLQGGRNSRLDELQAALLDSLLPHLESENDRRKNIQTAYSSALPSHARIVTSGFGSVAHLAVILVPNRELARSHLNEHKIGTDIHYPILDHCQPAWRELATHIAPAGLPVVEKSVKEILSIPCHPYMTDAEVSSVIKALETLPQFA
jgi:dTDP-4-amino-4,6-dideoxygalactose transaminase